MTSCGTAGEGLFLLALRYYDVPELVDKLSFALTLSSLLLAILAIFYTIISAQKQDINFSKLIETNSDIKAAAKKIKAVSNNIDATLNEFPSNFKKIGSKIDNLSAKYLSTSQENQITEGEDPDEEKKIELNLSKKLINRIVIKLSYGAMPILYWFSESNRHGKNLDFSTYDDLGFVDADFAIGFLNGFRATGLIKFKIHQAALIPTECYKIITQNLRTILETVIKVTSKDIAETLENRIKNVDKLLS